MVDRAVKDHGCEARDGTIKTRTVAIHSFHNYCLVAEDQLDYGASNMTWVKMLEGREAR